MDLAFSFQFYFRTIIFSINIVHHREFSSCSCDSFVLRRDVNAIMFFNWILNCSVDNIYLHLCMSTFQEFLVNFYIILSTAILKSICQHRICVLVVHPSHQITIGNLVSSSVPIFFMKLFKWYWTITNDWLSPLISENQ